MADIRAIAGTSERSRTTTERAQPAWTERAAGFPGASARVALEVLNAYPYGIVVARRDGRVIAYNPAAERLLGDLADRLSNPDNRLLCEMVCCRTQMRDGVCLLERALADREALPEVRVDLPPGARARAAWVTVAPLDEDGECVVAELRPGLANDRRRRTRPHWTQGPRLYIRALGRTRVESAEGPIGGQWLENRAGQVLKYLVAERHRIAYPDDIVETLWEDARLRNVPGVRYYIHQLRERLEPERSGRGQSSFIARVHGGTFCRRERRRRRRRVRAARRDRPRRGGRRRRGSCVPRAPARAGALRRDFLADEPYAEWAMVERDRLRSVAADGLRALAELRLADQDLAGAVADFERLADLEPYDVDVHQRLIAIALRRGRRTEAVRRYNTLRRRMRTTFGEDLDFTLADIAPA